MKFFAVLLSGCIALSCVTGAFAEDQAELHCYPITLKDAYPFSPPAYRDYPAAGRLLTPPVPPVLDSAQAMQYKTALATAWQKGVDFDGHYTVAKISCGVTCMHIALIDDSNGKVIFPHNMQNFNFVHVDDMPLLYRPDSNLMILLGTVGTEAAQEGVHYFTWSGGAMTLLESIPVHKQSCN